MRWYTLFLLTICMIVVHGLDHMNRLCLGIVLFTLCPVCHILLHRLLLLQHQFWAMTHLLGVVEPARHATASRLDPTTAPQCEPCTPHVEPGVGSHSADSTVPISTALPVTQSTLPPPGGSRDLLSPAATETLLSTETSPDSAAPPQCVRSMRTRSMDGIFRPKTMTATKHPLPKALQTTLAPSEPTSYSHAVKSAEWRATMALKFDALHRQGTWILVPLPPEKNVVGCRWIFKVKQRANGTIERRKARLVAKGFHRASTILTHLVLW